MNGPADAPATGIAAPTGVLRPGATLGVFGGGQLGRMFVHAAQRMGYRVHVFSNAPGSPAGAAAEHEHVGLFTDLRSVASFALSVDAATLEFENVPTEAIKAAEQHTPVRPGSKVLGATQHRVREKRFLESAGAPVGPFAPVGSLEELTAAVEKIGLPAVLKTAQMGYDGKGQRILREKEELAEAWAAIGPGDCILEAFVHFTREVSVLIARGLDGEMVFYGPIENSHKNHILDVSVLPAPGADEELAARAHGIAAKVAEGLDAVGLICVEMFQLEDGTLLVNEIAPRPHNSGHLTIEACRASQFEQQVRAICGLPLGRPDLLQPAAMANLLGDLWSDGEPSWETALEAGASLHLYGKESPRVGRKMGHLTLLDPSPETARAAVSEARRAMVEPHASS